MEYISTAVVDFHMPALQAGGFRRCRDATNIAILTDRCAELPKQGNDTGRTNANRRSPVLLRKRTVKPYGGVGESKEQKMNGSDPGVRQPSSSAGAGHQVHHIASTRFE